MKCTFNPHAPSTAPPPLSPSRSTRSLERPPPRASLGATYSGVPYGAVGATADGSGNHVPFDNHPATATSLPGGSLGQPSRVPTSYRGGDASGWMQQLPWAGNPQFAAFDGGGGFFGIHSGHRGGGGPPLPSPGGYRWDATYVHAPGYPYGSGASPPTSPGGGASSGRAGTSSGRPASGGAGYFMPALAYGAGGGGFHGGGFPGGSGGGFHGGGGGGFYGGSGGGFPGGDGFPGGGGGGFYGGSGGGFYGGSGGGFPGGEGFPGGGGGGFYGGGGGGFSGYGPGDFYGSGAPPAHGGGGYYRSRSTSRGGGAAGAGSRGHAAPHAKSRGGDVASPGHSGGARFHAFQHVRSAAAGTSSASGVGYSKEGSPGGESPTSVTGGASHASYVGADASGGFFSAGSDGRAAPALYGAGGDGTGSADDGGEVMRQLVGGLQQLSVTLAGGPFSPAALAATAHVPASGGDGSPHMSGVAPVAADSAGRGAINDAS